MKKVSLVFFLSVYLLFSTSTVAFSISAASYCVLETHGGKVLYEHQAHVRRGMASTTKIMTAIVALESGKIQEIATVSKKAAYTEGSSLYLKVGETVLVHDLVYGLMLNSGNDAAVVLAEHIGGSEEAFVEMMNETAKKIGVKNTHFVNPNGLSDDDHYTTAYDLACITRYALKNPIFSEIVATKKKTIETVNTKRKIYLSNHNKLLTALDGADGVKTGFTKATGRCLVSSATRNGFQTVCVTLGAPDDWQDHTQLHNLAFSEYSIQTLIEQGTPCGSAPVQNGGNKAVCGVLSEDVTVVLKNGDAAKTEIATEFCTDLSAPILRGSKIGEAKVYLDGEHIQTVDILAEHDVEKLCKVSYKDAFMDLLGKIFCF